MKCIFNNCSPNKVKLHRLIKENGKYRLAKQGEMAIYYACLKCIRINLPEVYNEIRRT